MKRLPLIVTLLAVGVLAAGCGSDSTTDATPTPTTTASATQVWADGVCSSITTWKAAVTTAAASVSASGVSQDSLKSAAGEVKTATATLQSDLKGLGKPGTESGQQAQELVNTLSGQLSTDLSSIQTAVDGITNIRGVLAAVPTISATLVTMTSEVSTTFTSLKALDASGELKTAFDTSSACQQLTSPSPTAG